MSASRSVLAHAVESIGGVAREGQERMTEAVERALNGGDPLLAQAGTGTGKSLAYLSAALTSAAEGGTRTVISTATLALQRQILVKDAPVVSEAVAEVCGNRPRVAVLKGWSNYVCRHKISGGYPDDDEDTLFSTPRSDLETQVARLREWAETTETGERDDLDPGVSDRAWRQVSISKLECMGNKCPFSTECFPMAARAKAGEADVVVTNHALLGIAAFGSPGVLPEFDALIVDEAHDIVPRATSAATVELSAPAVDRAARATRRLAPAAADSLETAASQLRDALESLEEKRLLEIPGVISAAAITLGAAAREALTALRGEDDGARQSLKASLTELVEICDRALSDSVTNRTDVAWIAVDRTDTPRLWMAPLDVSGGIREHLLTERAVVATSATLSLGGRFDSAARSLGLTEYVAEDFGSPFDYGAQGIVYAAAHLPKPTRDGVSDDALAELVDLIHASGGGALCLFSSRRGAEAAAEYARERLELPIYCQGEDTMSRLIETFRTEQDSCLFGTLSLWQGVDVPGQSCRLVTIDRIPFPRPDDPIVQARTEVAERAGRSGFMDVSLQHAALLIAQGSGRLIRTIADRGLVAILDSRVVHQRYGRYILDSMPAFWRTTDPEIARAALTRLSERTEN
ncbi:ATP-dependent DNA helicase DinG [Ruaniaceae bacterium KH17]|nr:ATP-dependent DNA helicase DinG [Ruaniaceae bacterium KH17]